MKAYRVTAHVTVLAWTEVHADSPEQAKRLALRDATNWSISRNSRSPITMVGDPAVQKVEEP